MPEVLPRASMRIKLVNGDVLNFVNFGPTDSRQSTSCEGAERLNQLSLRFTVERVEDERGLA